MLNTILVRTLPVLSVAYHLPKQWPTYNFSHVDETDVSFITLGLISVLFFLIDIWYINLIFLIFKR